MKTRSAISRSSLVLAPLLATLLAYGCGVSKSYFGADTDLAQGAGGTAGSASGGSAGGLGGGGDTGGGGSGGPAATCTPSATDAPVITALPSGVTAAQIAAICPAVGADSQCGVVIIITNAGTSIYYTGQGPFDGHDDTLVGVLNNGTSAVNNLTLGSNQDIMGFDGDGMDTFNIGNTKTKPASNSMDKTTYGGPNAYFTSITNQNTQGVVNFITPIAAGSSGYFSLENSLTSTNTCLMTKVQ